MKIGYEKPVMEFEEYELDTAIAAGCTTIVSLGPGDGLNRVCDEYIQELSLRSRSNPAMDGPTFYEGSCSCYLTSSGSTLLTS